ncbi:sulfate ABC transporter permease subunit CysT [Asticcacaulis sp. ZE23SCel15]|uniref:sulfate ABC transporter permease subunit CysT n=1 Tax=Asticcacaulis sp. ZE23SCel15 TaxID=3059027 RepID=UPI00265DFDCB|nr:sulfate ABC transporter permease subunit CysT [Asticcacaulis sp. ZE23SCel15]WKL58836.1 sulfate ABC transporter permease subunit CysT [Asticcacaulis sp. ZE23SCel15]
MTTDTPISAGDARLETNGRSPHQIKPEGFKPPKATHRTQHVLPGFHASLGITLTYLSLIVLLPLVALVLRPWEAGLDGFIRTVTDVRVVKALQLSFTTAFWAAVVNLFAGLIVAWVLTRYEFPGKKIIDAIVDLPFALPTAVAGVSLSSLYAPNGWVGSLFDPMGIKIAYTPIGIFIALVFIGLPFVVRSVQPVLAEFDAEVEEAALTLGATPMQTAIRVILPSLAPALITGFSLAFARAVGEYGSVIFIAGNMPYISEISPLLIVIKLEEFDYAGAASVAIAMLALSFTILLATNFVQVLLSRRGRA